jgi:kumamolisin
MAGSRVTIPGSERSVIAGARLIGPADATQRIHVTIVVRRKAEPPPLVKSMRIMQHDELVANHGATANDLLAVREFARQHNLQVIAESAAKRTVTLAGAVGDFSRAFEATIDEVHIGNRSYRQRVGTLSVPQDLAPIIVAILGLDNRPQAEPRYRSIPANEFRPRAGVHPLAPLDVAALYKFPPGDGTGQTIAIIELGGGFAQDDLNTYFHELGLPVPTVTAVSIMGQGNNPGVDPKTDGEVMLDIEVAGAVSPGAHQRVYFAPNSDQGFLAAVKAAIHDNPTSLPAAISISFGNPESLWTAQTMTAMEAAFQDAANLGIPVCVASGDDGSSDGATGLNVDFPASAPHALGCGGTLLQGSGSVISSEVVWNGGTANGATGGGVSGFFAKPAYQASANVPAPGGAAGGRGVPDEAGKAADGSPYKVRISGVDTVAWGTSAVSPLWSGLIARLAQGIGKRVGFLQPLIYQSSVEAADFFDITQGNNDESGGGGPFSAGHGWDPCTGLGSPEGTALLTTLKGVTPPTPHPPTPHPPTPHPPTPHPPTPHPPTPHPPTPHPPTPTPPTPTPSTGTGTGIPHFEFPVGPPPSVPPFEEQPAPQPVPPTPAPAPAPVPALGYARPSNAVAIVGVVGIVAALATVAVVGTVARIATDSRCDAGPSVSLRAECAQAVQILDNPVAVAEINIMRRSNRRISRDISFRGVSLPIAHHPLQRATCFMAASRGTSSDAAALVAVLGIIGSLATLAILGTLAIAQPDY